MKLLSSFVLAMAMFASVSAHAKFEDMLTKNDGVYQVVHVDESKDIAVVYGCSSDFVAYNMYVTFIVPEYIPHQSLLLANWKVDNNEVLGQNAFYKGNHNGGSWMTITMPSTEVEQLKNGNNISFQLIGINPFKSDVYKMNLNGSNKALTELENACKKGS